MENMTDARPLPDIFVGREIINDRVTRFRQTKHPLLSQSLSQGGTPREETKTIWYSREYIQVLMDEMALMQADGVRVYLGAYGNEQDKPEGQLCLLMVLTRPNGENRHKDIIQEDEPWFLMRKSASRSMGNGLIGDDGEPREYNYGAPCPPICAPDDDEKFPE
jgi:hypothetical protein